MSAFWVTAGLVFARLNGLLLTLPIFSTHGLPRYVAVLLAVLVTILVAPGVPLVQDVSLQMVLLGVAGEILLGAALGMICRSVFAAFSVAAELLARQTAMGMDSQLDPVMKASQSSLGVLASWLAGLTFLTANLHLRFLVLIADSFAVVAPGGLSGIDPLAEALVDAVEVTIVLGFQIAGPLVALVFLVNVFIGILARLAPRMNVFFSIGMTLNSVVGIWLFAVALPWMLNAHEDHLRHTVRTAASVLLQVG